MYSKKKLFIFHNEKAVTQIESQPNQSKYIESLIIEDLKPKQEIDIISLIQQFIHHQSETKQEPRELKNDNVSNSISNVLNLI